MGLAGFVFSLAGAKEGVWGSYHRNKVIERSDEFSGPEARLFAVAWLVFFFGLILVCGYRLLAHLRKPRRDQ